MTERHYAGVYWGDREASPEDGVSLTQETLRFLAGVDPVLSRWHVMRKTRDESLASAVSFDGPPDLIRAAFVEGTWDDARYGSATTLWNGVDDGGSAKLEITLGARLGMEHCPSPNSCVLQLPRGLDAAPVAALVRREPLARVLAGLARVWGADWGVVSTDQYLLGVPSSRAPHLPRVGWITYLAAVRGALPGRIAGVVLGVPGGAVISTTDETFTSDDGPAIDRVHAIEGALDAASLLGPTGETAASPTPTLASLIPASHPAAYEAALDVAVAVDAIASRVPARRADLAEALLRTATTLVLTSSVDAADDGARRRTCGELSALIDLLGRVAPFVGDDALGVAREAIARASSAARPPAS